MVCGLAKRVGRGMLSTWRRIEADASEDGVGYDLVGPIYTAGIKHTYDDLFTMQTQINFKM